MATFQYQNLTVHYRVIGTGEPLLILNGILMSVASWSAFEQVFSSQNKLILLDFADQGQTSRMTENYTQALQVELITALLQHLELSQINLMGISYGGEVAMQFALKHPNAIKRLVLANTTSRTSPWLRDIGRGWNEIAKTNDGLSYYLATIPYIYSTKFYQENSAWFEKRKEILVKLFSEKAVLDAFERLVNSAENYDVSDKLADIKCKTLILSGSEDVLTPLSEQDYLARHIPHSEWVKIQGCGHASMYEKPTLFASLVLGWVNSTDEPKIV